MAPARIMMGLRGGLTVTVCLKNFNASLPFRTKLGVHEAKRAISAHIHSGVPEWDGETERTWEGRKEGFYYFPLHLFRSFGRGGLFHTFVSAFCLEYRIGMPS